MSDLGTGQQISSIIPRCPPTFASIQRERYGHSAVAWGNRMVLFGGVTAGGFCTADLMAVHVQAPAASGPSSLEGLVLDWDGAFDTPRAHSPPSRQAHSAVLRMVDLGADSHDAEMVVFGGATGSEADPLAQCLDDLWVLSMHLGQWVQPETNGSAPSARCGHSATMVNASTMALFGGQYARATSKGQGDMEVLLLSEVWLLHFDTSASPTNGRGCHTWVALQVAGLPPRAFHAAAAAPLSPTTTAMWISGGLQPPTYRGGSARPEDGVDLVTVVFTSDGESELDKFMAAKAQAQALPGSRPADFSPKLWRASLEQEVNPSDEEEPEEEDDGTSSWDRDTGDDEDEEDIPGDFLMHLSKLRVEEGDEAGAAGDEGGDFQDHELQSIITRLQAVVSTAPSED
uniref:Uncharacterized protein n=1 Tax=Rhizochromulina marina TaxID=1034831 RepID=A0A7S2WM00_9STRA|mmetsp:Transcript_28043/g.82120  ORF Transcript_28043/g.82120 Transcript_28043/m.82120 type:complete len:401 (+) Transcript_28043:1-1203(+)